MSGRFWKIRGSVFIHGDEDYTISVDENSLRQVVLDLAFQLRDSLSGGEAIDIAVSREHVSLNTEAGSLDPESG